MSTTNTKPHRITISLTLLTQPTLHPPVHPPIALFPVVTFHLPPRRNSRTTIMPTLGWLIGLPPSLVHPVPHCHTPLLRQRLLPPTTLLLSSPSSVPLTSPPTAPPSMPPLAASASVFKRPVSPVTRPSVVVMAAFHVPTATSAAALVAIRMLMAKWCSLPLVSPSKPVSPQQRQATQVPLFTHPRRSHRPTELSLRSRALAVATSPDVDVPTL